MKALSLQVFKDKFDLTQQEVNQLAKLGRIEIQQNGYVGDILAHHKLVVFPDRFRIAPKILKANNDLDNQPKPRPPPLIWRWCRSGRLHDPGYQQFQNGKCLACGWNPKSGEGYAF